MLRGDKRIDLLKALLNIILLPFLTKNIMTLICQIEFDINQLIILIACRSFLFRLSDRKKVFFGGYPFMTSIPSK